MGTTLMRRLRRIDELLAREYGDRLPPRERPDPVASLVRTILSQNTTSANSSLAFDRLQRAFPTWDDVIAASVENVAEAIRPAGLANQRAARLRQILAAIAAAHGSADLNFLRERDARSGAEYLTGFTGVGAKTAACVVLFALGKPAFPVDTHVLRLSKRLALVQGRCTAERAYRLLDAVVPNDIKYRLHLNMVAHGRRRCRPTRPHCGGCPVLRLCRYEPKCL